jgi:ABC-type transport system involved in cytochrome c biogenesis permease component
MRFLWMDNWRFLFKNLESSGQILVFQLRTIFVFLILYFIIGLPLFILDEAKSFFLTPLFIIQGICLITVLIQVDPVFRGDVCDGFLEMWVANYPLSVHYYLGRHVFILLGSILPTIILGALIAPALDFLTSFLFSCLNLTTAILTSLWGSSIALLLARNYDIGQSLIGTILVPIFLIPPLLIGATLLQEVITSSLVLSHLWLYGGVSLLSIAVNLALAPFVIRLSIGY